MSNPPKLIHHRLVGIAALLFGSLLITLLSFGSGIQLIQPVFAEQTNLVAEQTTTVEFTVASGSVSEGDSTAGNPIQLTLRINPAISDSSVITVSYTTIDGTARAGSDYVSASGIVTFTSASTDQNITINTIGDTTSESSETFSVVLQQPEGAILGSTSVFVVTVTNDDAAPTSTPSSGTATPVYIDQYEGNDSLQTAYTLDTQSNAHCTNNDATFWPSGDIDYYRFWARAGQEYVVTSEVSQGIDTIMTLYTPEGHEWLRNDNNLPGVRTSEVRFTPDRDAYFFVSLINEDPSDPANRFYCIRFTETSPTLTPTATATTVQSTSDICEDNDSISLACVQSTGVTHSADFVPNDPDKTDIDFYRIWAKPGIAYTCETSNLADLNDTFMALLDANGNRVGENDDIGFPDLGSSVTYLSNYTGWLYVQVEPRVPVEYDISNLYTYSLTCTAVLATPTPSPFPTSPPVISQPVVSSPTPTPVPAQETITPIVFPTIDVIGTVTAAAPPPSAPTATPFIEVRPLPTNTPQVTQVFVSEVSVIIFYDRNNNNLPEIDEGVRDMPVNVYDGISGQLLTLGYTNEAGMLSFQVSSNFNTVRVEVPYLGISQVVSMSTSELLIRVASNISN